MFYACLSIFVLLVIMVRQHKFTHLPRHPCDSSQVICVTLAAIDLDLYNFGLYIVLLCIVGELQAKKHNFTFNGP